VEPRALFVALDDARQQIAQPAQSFRCRSQFQQFLFGLDFNFQGRGYQER
jgi:hypothetical protein